MGTQSPTNDSAAQRAPYDDPRLEASALAEALTREVARARRHGHRHVAGAQFPDTPRERPRNVASAPSAPAAAQPQPRAAAPRPAAPERRPKPAAKQPATPPAIPRPVHKRAPLKLTIDSLRTRLGICMDCGLSAGPRGSGAIVGRGAHAPRLMIVSDFAGPAERQRGKVFGAAEAELIGNLVKRGFKITDQDVYSTLAVKCPLGPGLHPNPSEMKACGRHLIAELELLVNDGLAGILALGPLAAAALGFEGAHNATLLLKVGARELPVVATDHPRDMLADPARKSPAWKAMQALLPHLA